MTLDVFHADGTDPVCNDKVLKKVKGAARMEAASFIIPCGKSSNPTACVYAGCKLQLHLPC